MSMAINVCQHRHTVSKVVVVTLLLLAVVELALKHRKLEEELVQAFRFAASSTVKLPAHLDPIEMGQLLPSEVWTIDEVHRNGLLHEGTFLFIVDSEYKLLLTRRSPSMVTCPNTWMPPGEHNRVSESSIETAKRGIEEEFGPNVWNNYVTKYATMTTNPLFYFRDYGPHQYYDNRIDQQLTYMWYIQLSERGEVVEKSMIIDKENTQYGWYTLEEVARWTDEKPEDFCHQTIIDLVVLGLKLLKDILGRDF
jgi:isopentenyldiphosphate isomerase